MAYSKNYGMNIVFGILSSSHYWQCESRQHIKHESSKHIKKRTIYWGRQNMFSTAAWGQAKQLGGQLPPSFICQKRPWQQNLENYVCGGGASLMGKYIFHMQTTNFSVWKECDVQNVLRVKLLHPGQSRPVCVIILL